MHSHHISFLMIIANCYYQQCVPVNKAQAMFIFTGFIVDRADSIMSNKRRLLDANIGYLIN